MILMVALYRRGLEISECAVCTLFEHSPSNMHYTFPVWLKYNTQVIVKYFPDYLV